MKTRSSSIKKRGKRSSKTKSEMKSKSFRGGKGSKRTWVEKSEERFLILNHDLFNFKK
jgi:hypothetical protein